MSGDLQGQVLLNTRPAHQQAQLTAMLEARGARVLSFPAIEIVPVAPAAFHRGLAQALPDYDILIFVSRNAVDGAFAHLGDTALPAGLRYGVIGSATRDALLAHIGDPGERLIQSDPFNSEALLAHAALQTVEGQRILILRGQAGRNLLGDELARRGAHVDYGEVYRRALPAARPADFAALVEPCWPTLVILTSNEGMHNLLELAGSEAADRLCRIPWLLISERMRESALKLGHNAAIVIAQSASDTGIVDTISDWAQDR
ncbi:MAG: uroporphyrinogen-III synthase [Gammaproteobacteria bacterium]|nr:uroporphyrinogen-III synthase [Gammaproteobacteria bacterium]